MMKKLNCAHTHGVGPLLMGSLVNVHTYYIYTYIYTSRVSVCLSICILSVCCFVYCLLCCALCICMWCVCVWVSPWAPNTRHIYLFTMCTGLSPAVALNLLLEHAHALTHSLAIFSYMRAFLSGLLAWFRPLVARINIFSKALMLNTIMIVRPAHGWTFHSCVFVCISLHSFVPINK